MTGDQRVHFHRAVKDAINRLSLENDSNTPDWVIADYLLDCLEAFSAATASRDRYYGNHSRHIPVSQWPTAKPPVDSIGGEGCKVTTQP